MSPKEIAATVNEVKLIVAQSMMDHIEDERKLRHETSEHQNKMFTKIVTDIADLKNATKNNEKALSASAKVTEAHMDSEDERWKNIEKSLDSKVDWRYIVVLSGLAVAAIGFLYNQIGHLPEDTAKILRGEYTFIQP